jgi:hypothetical protein
MQSVPSPLKLWVRTPLMAKCTLYSKHYGIKCVSNLWQVGGFYPDTLVSSTNKTDRHDITEILLKVALNTIIPNPACMCRVIDSLVYSLKEVQFRFFFKRLTCIVSFMQKRVMWCEMHESHFGIAYLICLWHMYNYVRISNITLGQHLSVTYVELCENI